jgi:hypothetical protein
LLSRAVRLEERIVDFLLEHPGVDNRLRPFTTWLEPKRSLVSLHLPEGLVDALRHAENAMRAEGGILFFHGGAGTGKRAAAEALSAESGRGLVNADARRIPAAAASIPATISLLCREARLLGANLHLAHADAWVPEEGAQRQQALPICESLFESIAGSGSIVFVAGKSPWPVTESALSCAWAAFEFPMPGFLDRTHLWQEGLGTAVAGAQPGLAAALANQFVLTGGQIQGACRIAKTHALLRGQDASTLTKADFEAAARAQSNQGLQRRAQKVKATHGWPDLVLPPRTVQQLREVCAAERYRSVIYSEWGFERRLMLGKGAERHRENDVRRHCGARTGTGPLQDRSLQRNKQIHRRNREAAQSDFP